MSKTSLQLTLALLLTMVRLSAQQYLAAAEAQYGKGHYEAAEESLRRIDQDDWTAEVYLLHGNCLHKMDRLVEALNDYDRAKILGLNDETLYLSRGICKTSLGYLESARTDLAMALSFNRANALAYYWLAVVEYLSLDNRASIRYLDEAIYLNPSFAEAYYMRGANYAEMGKAYFALDDMRSALREMPEHHRARFQSAVLTMDLGGCEKALEIFDQLMLLETDFTSEILYYRGWCYYLMNDNTSACNDWMEAARMGDAYAEESHLKGCVSEGGKPRLKRMSYGRF